MKTTIEADKCKYCGSDILWNEPRVFNNNDLDMPLFGNDVLKYAVITPGICPKCLTRQMKFLRPLPSSYTRFREDAHGRIETDNIFINIARENKHYGNIIDLPGGGVVRRYEQWKSVRHKNHIHLCVENNSFSYDTFNKMKYDTYHIRSLYEGDKCPLKLEYGDFWDLLHNNTYGNVKFRFVLFCHTKTFTILFRDYNLSNELNRLFKSKRITNPFYFMITVSKRCSGGSETCQEGLRLISQLAQENGWDIKNRWQNEHCDGSSVLSCFFLISKNC